MHIAIDVGGTNARIALFDSLNAGSSGHPEIIRFKKIRMQNSFNQDIESIVTTITELLQGEKATNIGVGLPGIVEPGAGGTVSASNLNTWDNKDIRSLLTERYSAEVKIANDAVCAALGEKMYGKHHESDFLFLIWGTGIGGCDVQEREGKLIIEPFEPGHQLMSFEGVYKRWEKIAAGSGFEETFGQDGSNLSSSDWERIIHYMALGIVNLSLVRPRELVVFGGGVALAQPERLDAIYRVATELRQNMCLPPRLELTELGDEAGLYGALHLHLL